MAFNLLKIKDKLIVLATFPFMLFIVSPLSFYYGNLNEITFSLSDVWFPVFAILCSSLLVLLAIQTAIIRIEKLFNGLLVGMAYAVWIQSQLLVWDFGLLDGRGIEWGRWSTHMWVEGVLWLAIVLSCICLFIYGKKKLSKITVHAAYVLGAITIASVFFLAPERPYDASHVEAERYASLFRLHPENNVIVIILDAFQSDVFEFIVEEHPDDVNFMDGFTFYRNTISKYPTTAPNMPAIMTGRAYYNNLPFKEYIAQAYDTYNLSRAFVEKNYTSGVISYPRVVPDALHMNSVLAAYSFQVSPPWSFFLDYGMFRASPTSVKQKIYNNGDWLLSFWMRGNYPPDNHGNDIRFLELFEKTAAVVDNDEKGSFLFFHFFIPHSPFRVDENLQYNPNLMGEEGYIQQARGALKLAQRLLAKLRENGLYDASEIVIMSDHGFGMRPLAETAFENITKIIPMPAQIHASALSLLLHKKPGAKGVLKTHDAPLYLHDLSCLLGVDDSRLDCREFYSAIRDGERKRRFLFYSWRDEFWEREYLPPMTEYFINGHAYAATAWRNGEYRYESGHKIPIGIENPQIEINRVVYFSANGESDRIVRGGWSFKETDFRWTDGSKAGMVINVPNAQDKNLLLQLKASPFLFDGLHHQMIGVFINGHKVADWQMASLEWYEAEIPVEVTGNEGLIEVVFTISDPTAPCEGGNSTDCRKLGMAAWKLQLVEL